MCVCEAYIYMYVYIHIHIHIYIILYYINIYVDNAEVAVENMCECSSDLHNFVLWTVLSGEITRESHVHVCDDSVVAYHCLGSFNSNH